MTHELTRDDWELELRARAGFESIRDGGQTA